MTNGDDLLRTSFEKELVRFEKSSHALLGIADPSYREVFIEQAIESVHRVKYVSAILDRDISPTRIDPHNQSFDPIKAAIHYFKNDDIDEACWLVFLFVHFGKHSSGSWRYIQDIYGALGKRTIWNWERVSRDSIGFREWLNKNELSIRKDSRPGGFGNHRKYESLNGLRKTGTGEAVQTYVEWIIRWDNHSNMILHAIKEAKQDPVEAFEILYQSMRAVTRFGRTARFDYLTMLSKISIAPIMPGSPYLQGATGPLQGARLMFLGNRNSKRLSISKLEELVVLLGTKLGVGMQVMEDSLCNWQKSPGRFVHFRG
jgi:hypothetical protein